MVDSIVFIEYPSKSIVKWDTLNEILQMNWSFLDMSNTLLMV
jgi:hypothetical protein